MSRTVQVTFDCADPNALAGFWNEALGYRYDSPPPGFATWEEALDHFGVPEEDRNNASASRRPRRRRAAPVVPEGARGQDRQEPAPPRRARRARASQGDERMAVLETECERLVALGATRFRRFEPEPPMSHGFIVMRDPEGNEFCLTDSDPRTRSGKTRKKPTTRRRRPHGSSAFSGVARTLSVDRAAELALRAGGSARSVGPAPATSGRRRRTAPGPATARRTPGRCRARRAAGEALPLRSLPNTSCMRSRLSGIRIIRRCKMVNAIAASSRLTP